jgi:hypothetical protein
MEFAKKKRKKKIVAGYGSLKRNNAFESFCWKKYFFLLKSSCLI